jgi:hypothetical protein
VLDGGAARNCIIEDEGGKKGAKVSVVTERILRNRASSYEGGGK